MRALAFSADGRWLVSAGDDAELRFWERAAAQPRRMPGHGGPVRGVCFTPEGRFILSVGDDGRLIIWDAGTGERVWTFEGQAQGLNSVCASPDARYAVTAGQDGVRVWELDWEFSFPEPADWHEGARPHLEAFLSRRSLTLPPGQSPSWSDADIDGLLTDLSRKGFGWVKPEAVRRELRSLSGIRAGESAAPGRRFWLALAFAVLAAAAVFAWLLWGRKAAEQETFAQRESPADRISPAQPAPPPAARPAPAQPQAPAAPPDDMALIPAGDFLMGSPEGEGHPTEQPAHRVHVSAFRIDRTPVTAAQYRRFSEAKGWPMRQQPFYSEDDHPVVFVDWHDAQAYCAWRGKRLPTEAEFEKAARGGTDTTFSFGNSPSGLPAHSWFRGNSEEQTHPVGTKAPNPYGLHDMSGNVMHWVADWFDPVYYRRGPERDPRGPAEGKFRTVRGCAWHDEPATCRAATRARTQPDSPVNGRGFRGVKQ